MDLVQLEAEMRSVLGAETVEFQQDGNRLAVRVIAGCFVGLNRVKRQQKVYGFLNDFIADGTLHAVSIKALTPEESI